MLNKNVTRLHASLWLTFSQDNAVCIPSTLLLPEQRRARRAALFCVSWSLSKSCNLASYISEKCHGVDFTRGDVTAFKSVTLRRDALHTAASVLSFHCNSVLRFWELSFI